MGLFNFRRKSNKETVQRETTTVEEAIKPRWTYSPVGSSFLLDRYKDDPEALSTFFGGVELISNSIAETPILVKDAQSLEIVKNHPLVRALKYGQISKFNLIKQLIHDIYVAGNGVAYIDRDLNGDVKELVYCPPTSYKILVDATHRKVYYKIPFLTKERLLDPSSVIHIFKNSKEGIIGVGIARYASILFPLASATDKAALEFFDSGGNVSAILQSKKDLDTEEKLEARDAWNSAFRGDSKNGNVAIIGNDFEYRQVGISQKEAQMIESREFNVLEICRYLNISPVLCGVKAGSTYNNIEQAQMDLVIHTLLPLIELIEEEFNKKLIRPSQRDKYVIDFEEEKIMFASKSDTSNYYTNLVKNGLISINEARVALGYVEKEGCDDLIIPYTDVNANKVNKDGEGEDKEEKE